MYSLQSLSNALLEYFRWPLPRVLFPCLSGSVFSSSHLLLLDRSHFSSMELKMPILLFVQSAAKRGSLSRRRVCSVGLEIIISSISWFAAQLNRTEQVDRWVDSIFLFCGFSVYGFSRNQLPSTWNCVRVIDLMRSSCCWDLKGNHHRHRLWWMTAVYPPSLTFPSLTASSC